MLDLLTSPRDLYGIASDPARRPLNRAFFHRLYLDTDDTPRVGSDDPTDPIAPLLHVTRAGNARAAVSSLTPPLLVPRLPATALEEGCRVTPLGWS
ncbi:hypothetical protein ACFSKW_48560 [Nonomuraea mangrovi]|uniref:Uncharacterized protein n=1 Tax=Nonomuraea mangrovi TaxID=2316207 RepID=A0ABW4TED0_9ACTN